LHLSVESLVLREIVPTYMIAYITYRYMYMPYATLSEQLVLCMLAAHNPIIHTHTAYAFTCTWALPLCVVDMTLHPRKKYSLQAAGM
jgi:hypothetical protein